MMWIVLAVFVLLAILETILTEVEHFGWATLVLIVSVAGAITGAQFLHLDVLGWFATHGVETILYVAVYVGVGLLWSFGKWFFFLRQFRDKFRNYKVQFLEARGYDPNFYTQVPEALLPDFYLFLNRQESYSHMFRNNPLSKKPRAINNKSRIVSWMSLWPFSLVGTLLNDPVRRLFDAIFSWVKGLYQKMVDVMFSKDVELK